LDELTSSRFATFMERSTAGGLMAPGRHVGVMAHGHTESENATYAIGAFAESGTTIAQNDNLGGAATMRVTWLPWYDEATNGRGLLHTGIGYSYRDAFNNEWNYSYRPESHLVNSLGPGTLTDIDTRNLVNAELAFVYGPFSVQSEYFINWIDRTANPDCKTTGAYVYFSYFLTGENRVYKRSSGVFERVKPYENFFRVRDEDGFVSTGKGAWELKYRYSYLDGYDDGMFVLENGGADTVSNHTLGVNWYLTPYTRFMFEYIHSGINQYTGLGEGDLNIFQMRAQLDF
ncbi:MAG: OprO/OprP family phosphate-selective porin, partial [Thermoguttaceae bacterium]